MRRFHSVVITGSKGSV